MKNSVVILNYIGGHPFLKGPKNVGIIRAGDTLAIYAGLQSKPMLIIPLEDITGIYLQKNDWRNLTSAAIGAIIGAIVGGGPGAIIGGAVGGRKKDNSIIILTLKYKGMEVNMLFSKVYDGHDIVNEYNQLVSLLR